MRVFQLKDFVEAIDKKFKVYQESIDLQGEVDDQVEDSDKFDGIPISTTAVSLQKETRQIFAMRTQQKQLDLLHLKGKLQGKRTLPKYNTENKDGELVLEYQDKDKFHIFVVK